MRRLGSVRKRCGCARGAWSRCSHSWTVVATTGYRSDGRAEQVTETIRGTRDDAEARLRELLEDVHRDIPASSRAPLSRYLRDRWLPHAATRVRPRTLGRYRQLLDLYVVPRIGTVPLRKLRPAHLQDVVDAMTAAGLAPRTTEQAFRVLSAALRQAVRWQMLQANPASAVQPPRVPRPELVTPGPEALRRLLDAAEGTRWYLPMALSITTGARRGEVLGLRWRDVDLSGKLIHVTNTLQRVNGEIVFVDCKTERSRRAISLPDLAVGVLRGVRKDQAERRLLLGEEWQDLDLVVERGDGGAVEPDSFSHAVQRMGKEIGLPGLRLHDLRHGYATALLKAGVHPKVVSEALGHASVSFTLDRYSHVLPGMGEVAASAIDEALAEPGANP